MEQAASRLSLLHRRADDVASWIHSSGGFVVRLAGTSERGYDSNGHGASKEVGAVFLYALL